MKKKYKRESTTLKDIYLMYPHRTYDVSSSTVPRPYFPASEISDDANALPYKEWKLIIRTYFKYLLKYLIAGRDYKLGSRLGELHLRKYKPKKKRGIDFNKTKEKYGEINKTLPKGQKKVVYHMNHHTGGYHPFIKWDRTFTRFMFQWHWRFVLSERNFKIISNELKSDPTMIERLQQVTKTKDDNKEICFDF